jgi:hypothetical protein
MSTPRDDVSFLLDSVASFMRHVGPDDLARLRDGSAKIAIVGKDDEKELSGEKKPRPAPFDASEVLRYLDQSSSREDGVRFLQERKLTVSNLKDIASALQIRTQKGDTAEKLMDKIVESTVGARLRGAAIRGDTP